MPFGFDMEYLPVSDALQALCEEVAAIIAERFATQEKA